MEPSICKLQLLKKAFLFLCLNLPLISYAQQNTHETQVQKDGLLGKVMDVKESTYEGKKKGKTYLPGKRRYAVYRKYDEMGNKIEESRFYETDEPFGAVKKWKYTYNAAGKITERKIYENDSLVKECKLDENGLCISHKKENNSSVVTSGKDIVTDKNGNITERTDRNSDGTLQARFTFVYNDKNQKISGKRFDAEGKLTDQYFYNYDNNGRETEVTRKDGNGLFITKTTAEYDEKGNEIKKCWYKTETKIETTNTWTYEYDAQGNWIKKTDGGDMDTKNVTIREIKYY